MLYDFDLSALRDAMRAPFPSIAPQLEPFYAMLEYHLGWRDERLEPQFGAAGKLVRPRLCTLACLAVGGQAEQVRPLAAALQLLHEMTLVHDDIQDRSEQRRGRSTVWRRWGDAQAINVGDALLILGQMALERLMAAGYPPKLVLDIIRAINQTALAICEGQYLDLAFEDRLELTESDYLAMVERKTARLLGISLRTGALAGGGSPEAAISLEEYGIALGLAYQAQDDVLGIWGDPAVTGKPVADDLYRRKKSLPVVHALTHAVPEDRERLRTLLTTLELTDANVQEMLDILARAGSRAATEQTVSRYSRLACDALAKVPQCPPAVLEELQTLAMALELRTS